ERGGAIATCEVMGIAMKPAIAASGELPGADSRTVAPAVTFWGVRGSMPTPGPGTVVFGGNTCCLEIALPDRDATSALILDAGSGMAALARSRDWSAVTRIDLLLSHLHHDHVLGLPFCKMLYRQDVDLHIWCGNLGGETAERALDRMFSPPLFPLTMADLPARQIHHGFKAGETIDIGGNKVRTALLRHPSGSTGYRFDAVGGSLAIITDIEHCDGPPDANVVTLCKGVDTLVYDSMLAAPDYTRCKGWGHSTLEAGVALAETAGARRLVGFHHSPEHDDMIMAAREARLQAVWPSALMAREGMTLVCAPSIETTR
ncbi:MAG: MBL fold metallo-hydrolase, partial [Beijerinckiaceae bacterium]